MINPPKLVTGFFSFKFCKGFGIAKLITNLFEFFVGRVTKHNGLCIQLCIFQVLFKRFYTAVFYIFMGLNLTSIQFSSLNTANKSHPLTITRLNLKQIQTRIWISDQNFFPNECVQSLSDLGGFFLSLVESETKNQANLYSALQLLRFIC